MVAPEIVILLDWVQIPVVTPKKIAKIAQLVEHLFEAQGVVGSIPSLGTKLMEDNAAGLVLRLALKTRFSEMGWGSTPLSSAI